MTGANERLITRRRFTRREFLAGAGSAAGLLAVGALPGCGRGPMTEGTVSVEAESGSTRTVAHLLGETEVPVEPRRVISLGQEDMLANLLTIGIRPLLSNSNLPDSFPGLDPEETEGVAVISASAEPDLERLATLEPDLIIGHDFFIGEAGYRNLSEIAPTVAVLGLYPRRSYAQTLTVFGGREQARSNLRELDGRIEEAGDRLDAGGRSVSLASVYPGASLAAWVDGPQPAPQLVLDLGFRLVPNEEDFEGDEQGRAFISQEDIGAFEGDTLILLQSAEVEGESEALQEVRSDELWQTLPAVQEDRVFEVDRLGYPGFPGLEALLGRLAEILEAT